MAKLKTIKFKQGGEVIDIDVPAGGGVDWQDVENKPELYDKTEINAMLGNKVDKETTQAQEVKGMVNFRGGITTDYITNPSSVIIDTHTLIGINADKKVYAGEYYEGLAQSDDTRLATRKYVADRFAELVGSSPEALDTIYELAEALQNNPDVINELLTEQYNLQNNKVDKTTKINGKALVSDINLTKADIGLSNVDNTSDLDKPISTAVQIELDKKANKDDLESEVARLDNEISEVDSKLTENIDKIISGRQTVGKALTAVNLTSQERHPIEDMFSTRITAKYENEIISSIDEETTAVIDEIGGFSVKQLVKDNETTVELTQGNVYLAKASGVEITLSSGSQTINLINGIAKFTASESGTYTFNGDILSDCKVYSLTEMGIDSLPLEQANQLLGNKSYPFGITNTRPSKLISVGENLFDWREFYNALKAVDPDNVEIVNKDGRECIKITNPSVYSNVGIKLWQGKFAPNVRYRFSSYHLNELNEPYYGVSIRVVYTDGTSIWVAGNAYHSSWNQRVVDTDANKTIDYIDIAYYSNSTITYFDISTMQLQMLDNPETEFVPYAENEVELPSAYADYGMPSLPNGVRDRIFRLGDRPDNSEWFYEKNIEKVILNGSVDFVRQKTFDTTVLFYYEIDNIKRSTYPQQLHVMNDFFTSVRYEDIYNDKGEGIASRSDQKGLTVGIKKSRIPGWDDSWTPTQQANAFKQWLQANPITVYYQLDEPQLTHIDDWNSQYLAYNYGREEIVDSEGNTTPTYTVIKYYPDYKKQTQTSSEIMAMQQATIQSLQSQLESIEARVRALEDEKDS